MKSEFGKIKTNWIGGSFVAAVARAKRGFARQLLPGLVA